jgi:hypothetical protein
MYYKKLSLIILSTIVFFGLISAPAYAINNRQGRGSSGRNGSSSDTNIVLTDSEKQSLVYLYEEEKMARDLYAKLSEKWGLNVFKNINKSEQKHMNSVANLAKKASVALPTNLPAGSFENSELQNLYNKLLNDGLKSKEDAVKVGVQVEKTDIADLQKTIASSTDSNARKVLNSLLKGSERHLKAFNNNL